MLECSSRRASSSPISAPGYTTRVAPASARIFPRCRLEERATTVFTPSPLGGRPRRRAAALRGGGHHRPRQQRGRGFTPGRVRLLTVNSKRTRATTAAWLARRNPPVRCRGRRRGSSGAGAGGAEAARGGLGRRPGLGELLAGGGPTLAHLVMNGGTVSTTPHLAPYPAFRTHPGRAGGLPSALSWEGVCSRAVGHGTSYWECCGETARTACGRWPWRW